EARARAVEAYRGITDGSAFPVIPQSGTRGRALVGPCLGRSSARWHAPGGQRHQRQPRGRPARCPERRAATAAAAADDAAATAATATMPPMIHAFCCDDTAGIWLAGALDGPLTVAAP
ncbi:MAG: hypothetical protein IRY86_14045, partial [Thermorudis peleae]|nr:hypothetical protein [Thermorudis peleae]